MTQLSEHFDRAEFACVCGCGFDTVDAELLEVLQDLRYISGSALHITSGCRCRAHNQAVGGAPGSLHLQGRAADIASTVLTPTEIYYHFTQAYPDRFGVGCYPYHVHIDTRAKPARWNQ